MIMSGQHELWGENTSLFGITRMSPTSHIIQKLLLTTESLDITHILIVLQSPTRKDSKGQASPSTVPQSPR